MARFERIAPPKLPYIVPVAIVPFGPSTPGEPTYLVGAPRIPSLRNYFCVPQNRIFGYSLEHGRIFHQFAGLISPEDGT